MNTLLTVLVFAALLSVLFQFVSTLLGGRRIVSIADIGGKIPAELPLLSVIITAKDEADHIGAALTSRLESRYPHLELIVVDDRSTDRTWEIISEIAKHDSRVKGVRIDHLPTGWLGKLHALNEGAKAAGGEWLLLSDGDAFVRKGTLLKVMAWALRHRLDHVAVLPEFYPSRFVIDLTVSIFFRGLLAMGRAYRAAEFDSDVAIGSGSFNLVKRDSFENAGGFDHLKMEVIDDVCVGQMIKSAGGRSSALIGKGYVGVRWYSRFGDLFRGMGRAFITGIGGFRVLQLIVLTSLGFIIDIVPFVALFFPKHPWIFIPGVLSVLLIVSATVLCDRMLNRSFLYSLFLPVGYVLIYIIALYGGISFWRRGGLLWRDTFYSTAALKKGRVFKYFINNSNRQDQ